jgi:hypothetical protein
MPLGAQKNSPNASNAARYQKRFGLGLDRSSTDYSIDNDYEDLFVNSNTAPTFDIAGQGAVVGSDGNLYQKFGGEVLNPMKKTQVFQLATNGSLGTQSFWIADQTYLIWGITEVHKTAGTDAGAVTAVVTIDSSGVAPGAGTSVMNNTYNLKGTANTNQFATFATTPAAGLTQQSTNGLNATPIIIQAGQRLSFVTTGTLTTLAGVCLVVTMTPQGHAPQAVYYANVNGDIATTQFYVAPRPMVVTGAWLVWKTNFASSATIDCTIDGSTSAPGAGTSILSAAITADGTGQLPNVPTSIPLSGTAANLLLPVGSRLSIKFSATTNGVGVVLVITFSPVVLEKHLSHWIQPNSEQAVAQNFFVADRAYELVDMAEVHSTAAGGAQVLKITIDRGTTAPGGGTAVDSTGFNLNSTAQTVQYGDSSNQAVTGIRSNRILGVGDRLGTNYSGAAQSGVGVLVTAVLKPC